MRTQSGRVAAGVLLGLAAACSCSGPALKQRGDDDAALDCYTSADCPTGLVCQQHRCVTPEGLPPEQETPRTFLRPAASARYVFVLSPDGDSVAVISTETLAIRTVALPDEPFALAVAPGRDAAVVLSRQGRAVSVLSVEDGATTLRMQPTDRRFDAVALSPDGRRAVLWTPEGRDPDAGAEGIVAILDVAALAAGTPRPIVERAAGRRHTDVFFREAGGVPVEAIVVGKEELAVLDLEHPEDRPLPDREPLPEAFAELVTREARATPDGALVLLRSLVRPELAVFDVAARALRLVPLPSPPSDLDLSEDGRLGVAVLRSESRVAWFPLPEALSDPSLVRTAPVSLPGRRCDAPPCVAAPGQAELAPDGSFLLLFTNAVDTEAFARFAPSTGELRVHRLEKLVGAVGIEPGGEAAVVLHRSEPGSQLADEYERHVDASEGYSVVDLRLGAAQLKLTGDVPATAFVFSASGRHAGVTLRDDASRAYFVDSIDLSTLVTRTARLASAPGHCGALPDSARGAERIWVSQEHAAGRISVVGLADGSVRTVTGFELNSEIEQEVP